MIAFSKDVPNFMWFIQEMQSVSFRGDGYVELTSQPLRSESSFGFSFRTLASEGLLLLSTFQGQANGDLVSLENENQL